MDQESIVSRSFSPFDSNTPPPLYLPLNIWICVTVDKMVEELKGKDDVLRKKVLVEINEDFH